MDAIENFIRRYCLTRVAVRPTLASRRSGLVCNVLLTLLLAIPVGFASVVWDASSDYLGDLREAWPEYWQDVKDIWNDV